MNAFWQWLMKTNARAMFLCALAVLIVASAYWGWQLSQPVAIEPILPVGIKEKPKTDLGLLAFVNRQLSPGLYRLPGNSFLTPGTRARPPRIREQDPVPPPDRDPVRIPPKPPPKPPPVGPPPPLPPPPPPPVKLTYKGIYRGSDGAEKAWIEDSESKSRSFYDVGTTIFGATIDSITTTEANITLPDGSALELKFGKEQAILEN